MADKEKSQRSTQFSDAFPGTQNVVAADGSTLTFVRLNLDDLGNWSNDLHKEWKKRSISMMPAGMKLGDRFQAMRLIEFATPTLDDIADLVYRADGINEALKRSLMKGGMSEADAIVNRKLVPPLTAAKLAQWIVTLFEARVPSTPEGMNDLSLNDEDPSTPSTEANPPVKEAPATEVVRTATVHGISNEQDGPNKPGSVPPLVEAGTNLGTGG